MNEFSVIQQLDMSFFVKNLFLFRFKKFQKIYFQGMSYINNFTQFKNKIYKDIILYFNKLIIIVYNSKFFISHLIYNLKNISI